MIKKTQNTIISDEEKEAKAKELKKSSAKTERQLKDLGIYDKTMSQQVEALSMDWGLIKLLYKKIIESGEEPIFEMMTSNGDTYKQINPIWSLYATYRKMQNDTLTKMGMNVYGQRRVGAVGEEELSEGEKALIEMNKAFRKFREEDEVMEMRSHLKSAY